MLPKYLTQDELQRFFAAIPSPRDRALFAVIYHYGLRVDEATAVPTAPAWLQRAGLGADVMETGPWSGGARAVGV